MADELSSNWVTVRYNAEKLLNFTLVRRKELITYQVEDAMKCGPKPKDGLGDEQKNNRSLKKCVGEQRSSYIRDFLIQN